MNTSQLSSPQILSGQVSIAPAQTVTVALDAMASRSHRWLRLDELSLTFYAVAPVTHVSTSGTEMGSRVKLKAFAYRQALTRDYVPTWLIGPRLHVAAEFAIGSTDIPNYSPFETYLWRFAKPFFLPPGSAFNTQLQRDGSTEDLFFSDSIVATLVLRGAQVSEQEARAAIAKCRDDSGNTGNPLPFIANYSPVFTTSVSNYKSNNLDLANPFLVPLQLQRMTARLRGIGGDNPAYGTAFGSQIRLTDTRTVICEYQETTNIFPATQAAWTHRRLLQPAEYITAELKPAAPSGTPVYLPEVAIIGYRNEVLP